MNFADLKIIINLVNQRRVLLLCTNSRDAYWVANYLVPFLKELEITATISPMLDQVESPLAFSKRFIGLLYRKKNSVLALLPNYKGK